ncbi:MAG: glycosyltransferase family 1 protein [Chloroflexi bacterium]|nr:glycosyltransferase family 1 protein [Chloroflexota bacterium]
MIGETVLLLTYYTDHEDCRRPLLKKIIAKYSPCYLPFDVYLFYPLKRVFSKVILYDFLRRSAQIGHRAMNREIMDLVRREHPGYVLWTSYYYDVFPETLDAIRQQGSITVGWYFDDDWRFDTYSKYWIPYLDYSVTNSIDAVAKYRALNARVVQTIPNTGLSYERDWRDHSAKYAVSFVGTRIYTNRPQWFEAIKSLGIEVDCFGEGWQNGFVPFDRMVDIFQKSKINLNFSSGGPASGVSQIKGRVFQVCMAGGFLLSEHAPGLENYFAIDKEIACFTTPNELALKVAYYLSHDEERISIARAGWERARQEYTSDAMVAKVFLEIERDIQLHGKPRRATNKSRPAQMRKQSASWHLDWLSVFLEDKNPLWKEELALSLRQCPRSVFDMSNYGLLARHYPRLLGLRKAFSPRTMLMAIWCWLLRVAFSPRRILMAIWCWLLRVAEHVPILKDLKHLVKRRLGL